MSDEVKSVGFNIETALGKAKAAEAKANARIAEVTGADHEKDMSPSDLLAAQFEMNKMMVTNEILSSTIAAHNSASQAPARGIKG